MVIRDPTMLSFKLLSDSKDERPSPHPTPKSKKPLIPKYDSGDSASGMDDTDPTWRYRKKYLGGDHFPSEDEGGSVKSDGEDEESITSDQILEMSDTEIIFAEPHGDEAKALRFKQNEQLGSCTLQYLAIALACCTLIDGFLAYWHKHDGSCAFNFAQHSPEGWGLLPLQGANSPMSHVVGASAAAEGVDKGCVVPSTTTSSSNTAKMEKE
ncbi:hypothetical protein DM860_010294 [Cuscuta australis]|uniref:Uncharacterized protein n=1 Tax=Cuscuta australis TaxID=267555 RepID=A0A328D8J9_9ASTE|nr:hypothetical protein DM860_010294 [Cuscuta australis]